MDRDARLAAMHWLEQRIPAVVVEIADARGSAPRGAGTRMLVSAVQAIGTIGGGHLEWKALPGPRAAPAAAPPPRAPRALCARAGAGSVLRRRRGTRAVHAGRQRHRALARQPAAAA